MDLGKDVQDVQDINILRLSILTDDLYKRMTTEEEGNAVIKAGWVVAGIADAIKFPRSIFLLTNREIKFPRNVSISRYRANRENFFL